MYGANLMRDIEKAMSSPPSPLPDAIKRDFWQRTIYGLLKKLQIGVWTSMIQAVMLAGEDIAPICVETVNNFPEIIFFAKMMERAEEMQARCQADLRHPGSAQDHTIATRGGALRRQAYPWMADHNLYRGEQILDAINQDFRTATSGCLVSQSPFLR